MKSKPHFRPYRLIPGNLYHVGFPTGSSRQGYFKKVTNKGYTFVDAKNPEQRIFRKLIYPTKNTQNNDESLRDFFILSSLTIYPIPEPFKKSE